MTGVIRLQAKDVKIDIIKPLHHSHDRDNGANQIYLPTIADSSMADWYMPTIFAYRLEHNSDEEYFRFVNRVKESLGRILVPFFPFAGRWVPHEKHGRQLVCNGAGVPFVEARMDEDVDAVLSTGIGGFRPIVGLNGHEALGMDPSRFKQNLMADGMPPIFAQITRFKCAGVILGVTFNHMHTDGQSFYEFMLSWAEIGRTNAVTIRPNFDRSLANMFEVALPKIPPEMLKVGSSAEEPAEANADRVLQLVESERKPEAIWGCRTYEVNASSIRAMKEVTRNEKNEAYISTGDCIVGHIWKSLFHLPDSMVKKNEIRLCTAIEGRNRFFDPPLTNLCGNVLTNMVCPTLPTEEVLEKPAHALAEIHRAKLSETKPDDWFSVERVVEAVQAISSAQFIVSSWFKFPLYDIDFGVGGRPYFSPGPNPFPQSEKSSSIGYCFVAPPVPAHSASAATVHITGVQEILDALDSSPEFRSLFLQSNSS